MYFEPWTNAHLLDKHCYNCWEVICECVLTVILHSVRTHDLDNDSYQHSMCGWFKPTYFVCIYVSVFAYLRLPVCQAVLARLQISFHQL